MAEAIALASGIAALLTLVGELVDISLKYSRHVRQSSKDIKLYLSELSTLRKILVELDTLAHTPKYAALWAERGFSILTNNGINDCREELETHLKRLSETAGRRGANAAFNRLLWPFRMGETQKLVDTLHRHQSNFQASLSLHGL